MTHRDRVGDPPREAAGDVGHRQGFPTPSGGSPRRPERRLPKAFGRRRARQIIVGRVNSGSRCTGTICWILSTRLALRDRNRYASAVEYLPSTPRSRRGHPSDFCSSFAFFFFCLAA